MLNGGVRSPEYDIFGYVSESVSKFCRDRGITLLQWYHDEPRWLLRWGEEPLRQIEIGVEQYPEERRIEVVVTPAVFNGREKGWRFGNSFYLKVRASPGASWFCVDAAGAVDLNKFEGDLREAYDEAEGLQKNHPVNPPRQVGNVLAEAYDKLGVCVSNQSAKSGRGRKMASPRYGPRITHTDS